MSLTMFPANLSMALTRVTGGECVSKAASARLSLWEGVTIHEDLEQFVTVRLIRLTDPLVLLVLVLVITG